jgi:uncharacterized iron-regulated protein
MKKICSQLVLPLLLFLTACGGLELAERSSWESPLYREHALAGTIWRVEPLQKVDGEYLLSQMLRTRFVLLGEKHDNPDHHQLQRSILQRLQAAGDLELVSFEMLDQSQQAALDTVSADEHRTDDALQAHLQWDDAGWNWSFYGPMLRDMLQSGVMLRAGNISSEQMMTVYGGGPLPAIDGVLDSDQLAQLTREIDESHCGMLPSSQFESMVRVQQARDASMARSLVAENTSGAVRTTTSQRVLITGNFHVRRDLGVPNYLIGRGDVLSLGILEVDPVSEDPLDYLQTFSAVLPYDYVWFTPAVAAEDYCAALRGGREQTAGAAP